MSAIVLIGDELSCAGFRLAGLDVRIATPAEVPAAFAAVLPGAALVLLSQGAAAALPPETLRRARLQGAPLVAVLPALGAPQADAAFTRRVHAWLGIET
jgi:vacuolar-type H+-ATPase subunit F/Vma7